MHTQLNHIILHKIPRDLLQLSPSMLYKTKENGLDKDYEFSTTVDV